MESDNVKIIKEVLIDGNITYIPDSSTLYDDIVKAKKNDILCSHFPLTGSKIDSGYEISSDFKTSNLNKFKLVLLGDIHNHQINKTSKTTIIYPGSIIPTDRSETSQKGFIVFDSDTLEYEFQPVSKYRKNIEIILNEETDMKELETILANKGELDCVIIKNKLKKIPPNINSLVEESNKDSNILYMDLYEPDTIDRGISSEMSFDSQLDQYLEINKISAPDKQSYINILKKVIKIN